MSNYKEEILKKRDFGPQISHHEYDVNMPAMIKWKMNT